MVRTHNLGFPRIGARRELKFALEKYWKGSLRAVELEALAAELRKEGWKRQSRLDLAPVGDFSLYDHVLDTSFLLGNVPARARAGATSELDAYFRVARGRAAGETGPGVPAGEMTKWFDTNYHYLVPEFDAATAFTLHADRLLAEVDEAIALPASPKAALLGPVSFLFLGKSKEAGFDRRLTKPADLASLEAVLAARGIERHARPDAAAAPCRNVRRLMPPIPTSSSKVYEPHAAARDATRRPCVPPSRSSQLSGTVDPRMRPRSTS